MSKPMVEIHLVGIPVAMHQAATEHAAEVMREFGHLAEVADEAHVPSRLVALDRDMQARFSHFTEDTSSKLDDAIARGATEVDLVYTIPSDAGDAAVELGDMWREVDRYCEDGRYLLALRTPPVVRAYRDWFLGEFSRQARGGAPVSWGAWISQQPVEQLDR
ncbi:MAG TPA: hypothetical protein VFV02_05670 [Acidimicrobiales bacterium]|nr:hypothetical protein [Acidimicrobiales bacterium]